MEDDFLLDDVDDEKTIEFIKNYLPQELKEKFSDDEYYYFADSLEGITVSYEREQCERVFEELGSQAVVLNAADKEN